LAFDRRKLGVALAAVVVFVWRVAVVAQTGEPKFDVASVKSNGSGDTRSELQLPPGGRFVARNVPLKELILLAYGLQDFQLVGAPDWIAGERIDIDAKTDTELVPGKVPPQLRALLAERFQLAIHREMKEMPVYALMVARADGQLGPQLHVAPVDNCAEAAARARGAAGSVPTSADPPRCLFRMYGGEVARSMGVAILASRLASEVGRFVIDETGLAGLYDYDMTWSPDSGTATGDTSRPSLFTALREQLGLKLDSQRAPIEVTVIDRVEHLIPN
jgi:uncharacterized protein (TIGR03435 family)